MKKKLKRFKIKINPDKMGEFYNSLVKSPAIQENFIAFNSENIVYFTSNEKRMITGPLMIPDLPILRKDKDGEYYQVFFTKESINEVIKLMSKNNRFNEINLDHKDQTTGAILVESWLVGEEGDKIYSDFGFTKEEIPSGSWVGTYYIENDELWSDIKNGVFRGFSIQGVFELDEQFNEIKEQITDEELKEKVIEIKNMDIQDEEKYELLKKLLE